MRRCEAFCIKNNTLNEDQILQLIHGEQPTEFLQDNLILHGVNGKSIVARSANQQRLVDAYDENDLLFAIGPAGSGKTYTAIALAVRALKNREVKRIILSPLVRLPLWHSFTPHLLVQVYHTCLTNGGQFMQDSDFFTCLSRASHRWCGAGHAPCGCRACPGTPRTP